MFYYGSRCRYRCELLPDEGREKIIKIYEQSECHDLMIIPGNALTVEQVKPLTSRTLQLMSLFEIDKKTLAGVLGVPAFFP